MRRSSFVLTVSAIALLAAGSAAAQTAPLRLGQSVSGSLTAEDQKVDSEEMGQYVYDTYSVRLREGDRIEATLRSDAFDAYLEAFAPDDAENAFASDDDSLDEGQSSRMRFVAPSSGTYIIRARTLSGLEGGDYTLQVSERPAAPRAPRPTSLTIGEDERGAIADTDPVDDNDAPYDAYSFRAREGQRYAIRLDSDDFDPIVRVGSARGRFAEIASNDDSGAGGLNSYLIFTPENSGEYIIRAQPLDGTTTGSYTVSVDEAPPAAPRHPIAFGDTLEGNLGRNSNDFGVKAEVYTFHATAGQRVTATLSSEAFDTFLELFNDGTPDSGGRYSVDSDDDGAGEGTNSRITYSITEDGDYTLEARAFNGDGEGPFTLSFEEAPPLPTPEVLAFGATVQGEIKDGDAVDDENRTYDAYTFTGVGGNRVQLVMRSGDFDTYLQLGSADGEFYALASDDDGLGEGTDSRLIFTLPNDGDYIVRASPLSSDDDGLYSLELIDKGPQPAAGSILIGATARGTLTSDDGVAEDGAYYDAYRITAKAGQKLNLTLVSNAFDAFLDVGQEDESGTFTSVISDDDSLSDTHAKIQWSVETDGDYIIRARSYASGGEGPYSLTVEERQ